MSCLPAAVASPVFGGSASLTSDYVWRGTTQSKGDPAVQAGARIADDHGWYGSVWGSSLAFASPTHARVELDFVVGWTGVVAREWMLDLNLTHYRYPSTTVDLDWTEVSGTATWKDHYWLQVGASSDALAAGAAGMYAQLGARVPLGGQFRLEGAVGRYWLEGAHDGGYTHAQLGAAWAFKAPLELRVIGHDTDTAAGHLFPGLAGARVEAALHASF